MHMMKAWVLHGVGDIRYEEADRPEPTEGEVLVEVKAAGICGSDIPRIYRTGAHIHPLILGHEFSGKVVQTGKNADRKWLDKRVGIFPLVPCRRCESCRKQRYELCCSYSYLGSRRDGGFAGYAVVPEWNLVELPDSVTYEQAAVLEPMAVAVHAMRNALIYSVDRDAPIAVCGFGTIGMLLAMLLQEAGYSNIYAAGNKDYQKEAAVRAGIGSERFYDNKNGEFAGWLMEQTGGVGVKVFFECVGKNETVSEAVDSAAPDGTVQLVGNPVSDMLLEKNTYWKILRSQLTVKGSWNSSFRHSADDDWNYVLERIKSGRLHPEQCITHRIPMEKLDKGLQVMRDKTEDYIKVMAVSGKHEQSHKASGAD